MPQLNFSDETSQNYVPLFDGTGTIILAGFLTGAFENHANLVTMLKDNKAEFEI